MITDIDQLKNCDLTQYENTAILDELFDSNVSFDNETDASTPYLEPLLFNDIAPLSFINSSNILSRIVDTSAEIPQTMITTTHLVTTNKNLEKNLIRSKHESLSGSQNSYMKVEKSKRTKLTQACDRCREKKKKCDAAYPSCSRCLKEYGVSLAKLHCQYEKVAKKRGPKSNGARTILQKSENDQELELENIDINDKIDTGMIDRVADKLENKTPVHQDIQKDEAPNVRSSNKDSNSQVLATGLQQLLDTSESTIHSTNGFYTYENFTNANNLYQIPLNLSQLYEEYQFSHNHFPLLDLRLSAKIPEVAPTLEYHLVELFYATSLSWLVIEDQDTFFNNFWPINQHSKCLINAMCSYSCRFSSHPELFSAPFQSPKQASEYFAKLAAKDVDSCPDVIQEIQTRIILGTVFYGVTIFSKSVQVSILGVRKCQLLRFDGKIVNNNFEAFSYPQSFSAEYEKKMRRVWMASFFNDTLTSLGANMETIIDENEHFSLLKQTRHFSFEQLFHMQYRLNSPKLCVFPLFETEMTFERTNTNNPIFGSHIQILFLLRQALRYSMTPSNGLEALYSFELPSYLKIFSKNISFTSIRSVHDALVDWYYDLPESMRPFRDLSCFFSIGFSNDLLSGLRTPPIWIKNSLSFLTVLFFFTSLVHLHSANQHDSNLLFKIHRASANNRFHFDALQEPFFNHQSMNTSYSSLQILFLSFKAISACVKFLRLHNDQCHGNLRNSRCSNTDGFLENSVFNLLNVPSTVGDLNKMPDHTTKGEISNSQGTLCSDLPPFVLIQNPLTIYPLFASTLSLFKYILPSSSFSEKMKKELILVDVDQVIFPALIQIQEFWSVGTFYLKSLQEFRKEYDSFTLDT